MHYRIKLGFCEVVWNRDFLEKLEKFLSRKLLRAFFISFSPALRLIRGLAFTSDRKSRNCLEAPPGFEPGSKGFANLCLNHLAMAPDYIISTKTSLTFYRDNLQQFHLPPIDLMKLLLDQVLRGLRRFDRNR
jgi:hypothetical protein